MIYMPKFANDNNKLLCNLSILASSNFELLICGPRAFGYKSEGMPHEFFVVASIEANMILAHMGGAVLQENNNNNMGMGFSHYRIDCEDNEHIIVYLLPSTAVFDRIAIAQIKLKDTMDAHQMNPSTSYFKILYQLAIELATSLGS